MTQTSISTFLNLVGVAVDESHCVLSAEQLARLGALLLKSRPADGQAVCFLGGSLSTLASQTDALSRVVPLYGNLGDEPFVVIAGPAGGLALLALEQHNGYRACLFSDTDIIDRVVLVLSQFGDYSYSFESLCDRLAQRAFMARVIVSLLTDPELRSIDLDALLPGDQVWLALARGLSAPSGWESPLAIPDVRRLLQQNGCECVIFGQVDLSRRELIVLAAEGGSAPETLSLQQGVLAEALRSRSLACAPPAMRAEDSRPVDDDLWQSDAALTAAPLLREGRVWGMLLCASRRPLSGAARAHINGLAALLAHYIPVAPPQLTEIVPTRSERHRHVRSGAMDRRPTSVVLGVGMALLEQLSDGVVLADALGRLVGFNRMAAEQLDLDEQLIGESLAESSIWVLAPLLTDAVMGELGESRSVELPNGQAARVAVIEMGNELWAFVIQTTTPVTPGAAPPLVAVEPLNRNGARNDALLLAFSNIIRTPLSTMRDLMTQIPTVGRLNEEQSRLLGKIVYLNSELTMLSNDLLSLGQLRRERHERIPLRLDMLIEAAIALQYAESGRRGQQVVPTIAAHLPLVLGDDEGLGRAIAALLDNAIKYSAAGAQIDVVVTHDDETVTVAIHDMGVGLTAEEVERVFEPFYRAPSTEHLGVAGRGLGLTITRAVIEQHGGRIWAESWPGRGSVFAFRLFGETLTAVHAEG
jgi:signal transduction histidine kinase